MDNETGPGAIVVISTANTQSLPAEIIERLNGYYLKRRFAQNEGVYRYSTIVDIYEPVGQQESVDTKV